MATATATSQKAECPDCAAAIALASPIAGEIVDCPDCSVELEVTRLSPLTLAHAPKVQEDWGE